MGEFDLIKQYFNQHKRLDRDDILQTIGDDCAVTQLPVDNQLAITTDTLVLGTHFLPTISPADLAYKSVAVNLSDLAAMGAKPAWVSLALTLSEVDHQWLADFSQSLFAFLDQHQTALIGGDTTKGHLAITLTAQGFLPKGKGLYRHKAKVGDLIYVSGYVGDSSAGLDLLLNPPTSLTAEQHYLIQRHLRPTPRIELGQLLLNYSQCAIDISDGLLADLGHILERGGCGAEINVDKLPLSTALLQTYSQQQAEQFALTGGEDYELCFTVPKEQQQAMEQAIAKLGLNCTCIGSITDASGGLSLLKNGQIYPQPTHIGFDHFTAK
ncbi:MULTISPECIES: thiamine-phosphate kinase [Glaesserella]|uniref:Thiamine-monophosphate kinase n=1 Tax=Glaesserella australis TaxID=2094024 RepID=A0A328BY58_9PAST|nr:MULTISPECIES: thiamine-phosphate kinase [Glaesserella]AUI66184.1 thiamine-phosphate kinase [Glaesserella sp. 15-184]RAL19206.1 thiamine-phosphate kinase [Glaesserella australis]